MARQAAVRCTCPQIIVAIYFLLFGCIKPWQVLGQANSRSTLDECTLASPVPASDEVKPSFVASYPGSGASLARVLIPALTGLKTGTLRNMVGQKIDAVSLKTHFPQIGSIPSWAEDKVKRVVILVRNPMSSIPSYCNYVYESEHGLAIHSEKAPTEYWVDWRDERFVEELQHWVNLVDFWMEKENMEERHLLVYEDLVDDDTGAETAAELKDFFDLSPGIQPVDPASIPCLWEKIVKGKDHIKILHGGGTKRSGSKDREFTMEQLELMSSTLLKLARKYLHDKELNAVLNRYLIAVHAKYQAMLEAALATR